MLECEGSRFRRIIRNAMSLRLSGKAPAKKLLDTDESGVHQANRKLKRKGRSND